MEETATGSRLRPTSWRETVSREARLCEVESATFAELVLVTHGVDGVTEGTVRHPIALICSVVCFHDHRKLQTTFMDGYQPPCPTVSAVGLLLAESTERGS